MIYCWWKKSCWYVVYPCFSHYLKGFIHPRWCRISSINSRELDARAYSIAQSDMLPHWHSYVLARHVVCVCVFDMLSAAYSIIILAWGLFTFSIVWWVQDSGDPLNCWKILISFKIIVQSCSCSWTVMENLPRSPMMGVKNASEFKEGPAPRCGDKRTP